MHMDGFVGPFAGEPELTPRPDVSFRPARRRGRPLRANPTAGALRAEDAVNLLQCEAAQRIGLVHDEHEARRRTLRIIVRASGKSDLERVIPECLVESHEARVPRPMTHEADVGLAGQEAGECLGSVDQIRLQANVTLLGPETESPAANQRLQGRAVNAHDTERHLLRLVRWQPAQIVFCRREFSRVGCTADCEHDRGDSEQRSQTT